MGWETRKGRQYFYLKTRKNGRVVSKYYGCGTLAESIAVLEEARREEEQIERLKEQGAWVEQNNKDQELRSITEKIRLLTETVLLINGYHTHKGQWRKKRERRKENEPLRKI